MILFLPSPKEEYQIKKAWVLLTHFNQRALVRPCSKISNSPTLYMYNVRASLIPLLNLPDFVGENKVKHFHV